MKQPKSFEEGMDRLQGLLGQLQDESRRWQIPSNCMRRLPV